MGGYFKKGQLTVFILLGISIMVVFFSLLKMSSETQRVQFEKEAEKVMVEVSSSKSFNHYIDLCLKQSAEQSIFLISKGGFRIYDSVNGSSSSNLSLYKYKYEGNKTFKVAFSVLAPKLNPPYPNSSYFDVPWYPEQSKNFNKINKSFLNYYPLSEYAGVNNFNYLNIPYLCDINTSTHILNNVNMSPCNMRNVFYWGNSSDTLQIQLENYTSYLFLKCIDKDFISEDFGGNVTIGIPSTKVNFGEYDTTFSMNVPIELNILKKGSLGKKYYYSTQTFDISTNIPVRFKRDYDFLADAFYNDVINLSFDLKNDYKLLNTYSRLNVPRKEMDFSVDESGDIDNTHIVSLTDKGSTVFGNPLAFNFYMQNRIPILDWIKQTDLVNQYDIDIYHGTTIFIDPHAWDPDDEDVLYFYEGWHQNESYFFDFTNCCSLRPGRAGCMADKPIGCINRTNSTPTQNWMNSDSFKGTNRSADYNTSIDDLGYHNVTVYACDRHWKNKTKDCDYQLIKIRISDIVNVIPTSNNTYSDINSTHASIEDIYTFEATNQFSMIGGIIFGPFEWRDNIEPFSIRNNIPTLFLPNETNMSANMTQLIINISKDPYYLFTKNGTHNITLFVFVSGLWQSQPTVLSIPVFQCLPHKNPNVPSYPFNNFRLDDNYTSYEHIDDPFQAEHTCCNGGTGLDYGTYKNTSVSCYNFVTYGTFWSFNNSIFTGLKSHKQIFGEYNVSWGVRDPTFNSYLSSITVNSLNPAFYDFDSPPYDYSTDNHSKENDIYKRSFDTYCNGNRGNICDNSPNETRQVHKICGDDLSYWPTLPGSNNKQSEKCIGPNPVFMDKEMNSTFVSPFCLNYNPGDSFDKFLRLNSSLSSKYSTIGDNDTADGQCGEVYRCVKSSPGDTSQISTQAYTPNYPVQSNFLAKGLCFQGGCSAAYIQNGGADINGNPVNTFYDKTSWNASSTIDCRCYARSSKDGSGGASATDNNADITNYTAYIYGNCHNGNISYCGTDACITNTTLSGYSIDNVFVGAPNNYKLRQYIPYDKDGVCGTKEFCGNDSGSLGTQYIEVDPDDDANVCKLFKDKIQTLAFWHSDYGFNPPSPSSYLNFHTCCYDDPGEIYDTTSVSGTLTSVNGGNGCRTSTECVVNNAAYSSGKNNIDVNSDGNIDYCSSGTWYDCNANDNHCSANNWCIGVQGTDSNIATLGSSAFTTTHNCVSRLESGKSCNRDAQCQIGDYCGRDYNGDMVCTPNTKCYMSGVLKNSGYNCLNANPIASNEKSSKNCNSVSGDVSPNHGAGTHSPWTINNCNNDYCQTSPLSVWTGYCSTSAPGCQNVKKQDCNTIGNYNVCNDNAVKNHKDACSGGTCYDSVTTVDNCNSHSLPNSYCSGNDVISYSNYCNPTTITCTQPTTTSACTGTYISTYSSATCSSGCGTDYTATISNRYCSGGACQGTSVYVPTDTCSTPYCSVSNTCGCSSNTCSGGVGNFKPTCKSYSGNSYCATHSPTKPTCTCSTTGASNIYGCA